MTMSITLNRHSRTNHAVIGTSLVQRLTAWFQRSAVPGTEHHTRDSAAKLYARAAHYERTQPGFAADLRAAAEAMDRIANRVAR